MERNNCREVVRKAGQRSRLTVITVRGSFSLKFIIDGSN